MRYALSSMTQCRTAAASKFASDGLAMMIRPVAFGQTISLTSNQAPIPTLTPQQNAHLRGKGISVFQC